MRTRKDPTWASLVEQALRDNTEEFLSVPMLMKQTSANYNQVLAALWHLRQHHVCDVVVENDGRGWWFALPIDQDTRTRIVPVRTPEVKKRKPRRTKVLKDA